jgi:anti-sigma regulatory factor (Ser/Thr protein kinase)
VSAVNGGPPIRLRVPARAENVFVVRQALTGLGQALALDRAQIDDIKIAVTEACTNVVLHAYRDTSGPLEIEAWPSDGQLLVVVRDEGRGITPRAEPPTPGLGLGMPLMAALTEEMRIAHGPEGGTEVHMTFVLVPAYDDHAG